MSQDLDPFLFGWGDVVTVKLGTQLLESHDVPILARAWAGSQGGIEKGCLLFLKAFMWFLLTSIYE